MFPNTNHRLLKLFPTDSQDDNDIYTPGTFFIRKNHSNGRTFIKLSLIIRDLSKEYNKIPIKNNISLELSIVKLNYQKKQLRKKHNSVNVSIKLKKGCVIYNFSIPEREKLLIDVNNKYFQDCNGHLRMYNEKWLMHSPDNKTPAFIGKQTESFYENGLLKE